MTVRHSAIYEGRVLHRRRAPVEHAFSYRLFMLYLDLDELDEVFRGRWLWSARRPAVAWLRRRDHLGDPAVPLADAVRDLVEQRLGWRPAGPVRLLTHLRYFGCCMNPVSFYYCSDEADRRVEAIVAEVHNTPWGERHCYVLDGRRGTCRHVFPKDFHVSPFMGMRQTYEWTLPDPDETLTVHMASHEGSRRLFDASMRLERRPVTGGQLARVLVRYPFMTGRVIAAIYLQAARLWLKRCPFHPHPRRRAKLETIAP